MVKKDQHGQPVEAGDVTIVRHKHVRQKLQVSSAQLFAMVARGLFPKPFQIIPGGRAVGWLESDVDMWILNQKQRATSEVKRSLHSEPLSDPALSTVRRPLKARMGCTDRG
jgi:prophage regulatory protein